MARYAVLHDVIGEETAPVGLAMEMDGYVLVHAPREYGIPERHDGEYRVLEPDGTFVTYGPGQPGYFDQVLVDLSAFGIGEQGNCAEANFTTVLHLIVRKIERERARDRSGEYAVPARAVGFSAVLHEPYCLDPAAADRDELAIAARGHSIVSA